MRVVIDTNVWVSAFLNPNGHPAQVVQLLLSGRLESVVSAMLLQEVRAVLLRPRLRKRHQRSEADVDTFVNNIRALSTNVEITDALRLCRDERDNFLLETALRGGASYIVTRDDDLKRDPELMELMQDLGVVIMSVSQLLQQCE